MPPAHRLMSHQHDYINSIDPRANALEFGVWPHMSSAAAGGVKVTPNLQRVCMQIC